jgi:hypothetical protein
MISVVYCTREHKPEHITHLKKTFGHPKVEIIEYINNGEGLTKFYQKAIDEAKFDIIVFCHDDIIIETKQVANKIKSYLIKIQNMVYLVLLVQNIWVNLVNGGK